MLHGLRHCTKLFSQGTVATIAFFFFLFVYSNVKKTIKSQKIYEKDTGYIMKWNVARSLVLEIYTIMLLQTDKAALCRDLRDRFNQ